MDFWNFTIGDLITICLVPVGIIGGYYIHKWLKSPVQIIQETNQVTAYNSLFLKVNEFDYAFQHFFQCFHAYFGSIIELERLFLPLSSKMIITSQNSKGIKQKRKVMTFEDFKTEIFDDMYKFMTKSMIKFEDIKNITRNLVSIKLSHLLFQYMNETLQYMKYFEKGEHTKTYLQTRYMWATLICNEIEGNEIINQFSSSQIKIFVKKWTDYIDSENDNPK